MDVKRLMLFFAGIVITIILIRFGYTAVNNGLNKGGQIINNTFNSVFGTSDESFIGDTNGDTKDLDTGNLGDLGEQKGMDDLFK